jgi:hypothetical protein
MQASPATGCRCMTRGGRGEAANQRVGSELRAGTRCPSSYPISASDVSSAQLFWPLRIARFSFADWPPNELVWTGPHAKRIFRPHAPAPCASHLTVWPWLCGGKNFMTALIVAPCFLRDAWMSCPSRVAEGPRLHGGPSINQSRLPAWSTAHRACLRERARSPRGRTHRLGCSALCLAPIASGPCIVLRSGMAHLVLLICNSANSP